MLGQTLGHIWRMVQERLAPIAPTPREGRQLVAHVLGLDEQALLKAEATPFPPDKQHTLHALTERRLAGEPLAYVLGYAPFWKREWAVERGVLIPRPDTETLVQAVLDVLPLHQPTHLAEVGVGSGAIIGSILTERPLATAVGTDISPTALRVAAANMKAAGVAERCTLVETNLLEGVTGPCDVILSNPPYIGQADYDALEPCVRNHEPREALLAEDDGLSMYKALLSQAASLLKPHGWLVVEIGHTQGPAVAALASGGWRHARIIPDMAGRPRVMMWQRG